MVALSDQSATLRENGVVPKPFDLSGRRVSVAGHRGLLGRLLFGD